MAKARREPRVPPESAQAPDIVAKPSSEAVLLFLKHAALESAWTAQDVANTLGIDLATATQVAEELALVGYAEPVPRKRDLWRNTRTGNTVSGARSPRLTRKTAEELLTGLADLAEAFNLDNEQPLRIERLVDFGGINTKHDRIQDIDLGVQLEPKLGRETTQADVDAALRALRGRSPSLKTHSLRGWPSRMGRVVWQA